MKRKVVRGWILGFICSSIFLMTNASFTCAAVNTYVVPAISDSKLLPAMQVSVSQGTSIPVTASLGERTSVSFVVRSDEAVTGLTAESSSFTGGNNTLPSGIAAIRVLKSWYQAGYNNSDYMWENYSNPSADRNYLTPELLLNDPTIVEVNGDNSWTQWNASNPNGKNYLRLKDGSRVDVTVAAHQNIDNNNIQDAATLQPADLPANYNRQYVVTFTIPSNAKAGDYTGTITLKNGTTTFKTMDVSLKVLPFSLPVSPVEYSIYYQASINNSTAINTYSVPENIWVTYVQDMLAHGVTNPMIYPASDDVMTRELQLRQQMGISNANLYLHHDGAITDYDHYKTLFAPYGVSKIYNYGPDESECNRLQIVEEHANGWGHFNAQVSAIANQVADILDIAVEFGDPVKADAVTYHKYGNRIFSYGNPQTVPEWPRTWRYNYGLLLWQRDFDGAMPFAYDSYAGDAWNDFSDYQWYNRGHMFVYPTANGVVDTIQWEGFSEGANDVKYAAALQNAIKSLNNPGNPTVAAAQAYLDNLKTADLSSVDLDAVRAQLQNYTLALYDLGADPSTTVQKTTPTISWSTPDSITYGTVLSDTQLNATASVPGTFVYTPAAGTRLSAGSHTLHADFTPDDTTKYNSASKEVTINVTKPVTTVPWYNASYRYRRTVTIDHTKVSNTDQSDFPVLVSLTGSDLRSAANGGHVQNENGYDIIFTDESGTKLSHEIETYNPSTGTINIWVKVPLVSPASDTAIYMYYGNSSVNSSQENGTGVWDNGYGGVWHFQGTGTNPVMKDSTSNNNDSSSQIWTPAAGQIGGSASFNGASQIAVVKDSTSLCPTDNITYSMWLKPSTNNASVFEKGIAYGGYGLRMNGGFLAYVAGWAYTNPTGLTVNSGNWQYVTVVFQKPDVYVYQNGVLYGRGILDSSSSSSGVPLVIGGIYSWAAADGYQARPEFNGSLDELHISGTARSADWVVTEYNNQSSPSTFCSLGSEEEM